MEHEKRTRGLNRVFHFSSCVGWVLGLVWMAAPSLAQSETKQVAMCELLAHIREFDNKEVAVEAWMSQYGARHGALLVLHVSAGARDLDIRQRPEREQRLYVKFPRDQTLKDATKETQQLDALFRDTAQYRTRSVTLKAAVIGVIRIAKENPTKPGGYRSLAEGGYGPYTIEVRKAWEIR